MKRKLLIFCCILYDLLILFIVIMNFINLYKVYSKKNLIDLIYSIIALIIFLSAEVILFYNPNKDS
jgi:hypothetical protein